MPFFKTVTQSLGKEPLTTITGDEIGGNVQFVQSSTRALNEM